MPSVDPAFLEALTQRAFPPVEMARLGDWRLAASAGHAVRINACWPLGEADRPPQDAVAAVEAWYAERGLPTRFKPADGVAPEELEPLLAARGYARTGDTLVMVGPVTGDADPGVTVTRAPDASFAAVFIGAGGDASDSAERIAGLARMPQPAFFARLDIDGEPAAIGASVVEGDWAGLFAMRTDARFRRQGLARRLAGALMAAAAEAGAMRAYLQVEADNAPAIGLYAAAGFERLYGYRCWTLA